MIRLDVSNSGVRSALIFMASVIGVLALAYAYLLNTTIAHGINIERKSKELSTLNASVSELEGKYFEAKNSVTLKLAKEIGFENADSKVFISRKKEGEVLSLKNEN